ncbi:MAG: DUF3108 domain-containing protein [Gammaproteobacteria bacterium]|nr:DUF3108 domain-containing protein [Gammaproteobacteria bacterium]
MHLRRHPRIPALLALLWLPLLVAAAPLTPFAAVYDVTLRGVTVARLTRELSLPAPEEYRFVSHLESTGLASLLHKTTTTEQSEGTLDSTGLHPVRYVESKVSGRKRRESTVDFQRTTGRIIQQHKGETSETPLEAATLDKLSYQLALMRDLEAGIRQLDYRVADDGRVKDYRLTVEGPESVALADGEVSTLRVVYSREGSGRRTTLWCAPALGNLPVKIEYRERDGGRLVALLRR